MRGETYVASVSGKNEPSAYAEMPYEPTYEGYLAGEFEDDRCRGRRRQ